MSSQFVVYRKIIRHFHSMSCGSVRVLSPSSLFVLRISILRLCVFVCGKIVGTLCRGWMLFLRFQETISIFKFAHTKIHHKFANNRCSFSLITVWLNHNTAPILLKCWKLNSNIYISSQSANKMQAVVGDARKGDAAVSFHEILFNLSNIKF